MDFNILKIIQEGVEKTDHLFCSEEDFRVAIIKEIEHQCKALHPLILTEYKYQITKKSTEHIDIYVVIKNKEYAIELKYCPEFNRIKKPIILKNKKIETNISDNNKDSFAKVLPNKKASIIKWKNKNMKHEYFAYTQYSAKDCIKDIKKMKDFINKYPKNTTA